MLGQPAVLAWEVKTFLKHRQSSTKCTGIVILKGFCKCVLQVNVHCINISVCLTFPDCVKRCINQICQCADLVDSDMVASFSL